MVFKLIQPATISFIVLFFIPAPGVCATTGQSNVNDAIIFNRSILSVIDGYYDPGRINPKAMLDAVVNSLQKTVAELKITHDDKKKTYRIEINDTPLIINYNAISSPWEISRLLTTIIKFVNKNINDIDYEPEDIEYAATNAMLATLDPHTNALKPEIFEELMFSTMGEFGGLGIKITTDIRPPCNGYLTIVEVFDDTPASKAGLKIGDRVIKINQESTLNITTSEAAKRMRGKPGSSVKITINRRKNKTITLDIVRGAIPIESVSHKLLDGSVGYVEILGFQESTAKELQAVLKTFNKKKIAGLILDLRGNPGGLLDAATNIADMFIKSGTIVTIAGRRHDEKEIVNAKDNGNEPLYPIVVLIDNYSASAAEILAGALKNHSRAILIGHTTFGKGSVQRIERLPDGGGIKMTRSQYLLPGGDSIQATGVLPHIKFIRTFVDPEMMNIDPSKKRFSEADLESHLTGDSSISHGDFPKINKSAIFIPQKEMKKDKKKFKRCYLSDSNYKPFVSRFELEFARELIEFHKGKSFLNLIINAKKLAVKQSNKTDALLQRALKKLHINWKKSNNSNNSYVSPSPQSTDVTVTAKFPDEFVPGEKIKIQVAVNNNTKSDIYRLIGHIKSKNPYLDGLEVPLGLVKAGAVKKWTVKTKLPVNASPRIDPVTIIFKSLSGPTPEDYKIIARIKYIPKSKIAYHYHIVDKGNHDGFFQPGEKLTIYVTVKNTGEAATWNTEVNLSSKPGIDVIKGRFNAGKLKPGESYEGLFEAVILPQFNKDKAQIILNVTDWLPGEYHTSQILALRKIMLNIKRFSPSIDGAFGTVSLKNKAPFCLRENPDEKSRCIGIANGNSVFKVTATRNGFFNVLLNKGIYAWLSKNATLPGGKGKPGYDKVFFTPPRILIDGDLTRKTDKKNIAISGTVEHPDSIKDVIVYNNEQKIMYLKVKGKKKMLKFSFNADLKNGSNNIHIIARHDSQTADAVSLHILKTKTPGQQSQ